MTIFIKLLHPIISEDLFFCVGISQPVVNQGNLGKSTNKQKSAQDPNPDLQRMHIAIQPTWRPESKVATIPGEVGVDSKGGRSPAVVVVKL